MTIYKFELKITDEQFVRMPEGSQILAVQIQHGVPCLWAKMKPEAPRCNRRILVHGTGRLVRDSQAPHIGTIQIDGGALIFHVFDGGECE